MTEQALQAEPFEAFGALLETFAATGLDATLTLATEEFGAA